MKSRSLFITATDTGVGKTVVTALLLAHLREKGVNAVAMKPISSGNRADGQLLRSLAENEVPLDTINPIHFRHPLAPLVAARMERRTVNTLLIRSALHALCSTFSQVLVEGIGGLLVPLRPRYFVRDLVRELDLPLLIVARPSLGTLNHIALTVEAARAAGIRVIGVVLNDAAGAPHGLAERTNVSAIKQACGVRVIARIPHISPLQWSANSIRAALRIPQVHRAISLVSKAF